MRRRHVIVVAVLLVIGLGVKLYVFPPKQAEADPVPHVSMNVLQMHQDMNLQALPVQKANDMSVLFDSE